MYEPTGERLWMLRDYVSTASEALFRRGWFTRDQLDSRAELIAAVLADGVFADIATAAMWVDGQAGILGAEQNMFRLGMLGDTLAAAFTGVINATHPMGVIDEDTPDA